MPLEILILLAGTAVIYGLFLYIFHPLLISPLARIPTPHWSCAISGFWILRARKRGIENRLLHDAHARYGPVVRVAPNTLSIDGIDAVRSVYQGGFDKWPWYAVFDNYAQPCIFSTLQSKEHSLRKRMVTHVYSKSFILSSPASKAQSQTVLLNRLLPLLRREAARSGSDGTEMQSILMATTMDLISAYVFGTQNSTNFLEDQPFRDHWLHLYLCRHSHHFWPQELPTFTSLCSKLGLRLYPSFVDRADDELRAWNMSMCDKAFDSLKGKPESHKPEDEAVVFHALLSGMDKETKAEGQGSILDATSIRQRHLSVASETFDQMLAGHETAGIVLTYLVWQLSQRPWLQDQLRTELLTLRSSIRPRGCGNDALPDAKELDGLPLLDAIIMESLRLHAPIPGPQPRITPYPSCRIGGYEVPGGVRIAALAYTLHLDERVYSDPRKWDHMRWLKPVSEETRREMKRNFWAFGSGGRMCFGSNFALTEMKLVVAIIYLNFRTSVVTDDGMEQTDGYSSRPKGEKLFLRLSSIDS